jgi:hypothetical protein
MSEMATSIDGADISLSLSREATSLDGTETFDTPVRPSSSLALKDLSVFERQLQ